MTEGRLEREENQERKPLKRGKGKEKSKVEKGGGKILR